MNITDVLRQEKNWVIIGDTSNPEKYANKIYNEFKRLGYNIISINPYDKDCEFKNLSNIPKKITAIDFCVNVTKGLDILKQYKNENIKYLLAQPGARSVELEQYCIENNILYLEDCALVQLKNL